MTVEDAKKKWASARDRYRRLKKAADLPSGSAADDGTAWEHMKPLQFLDSITEQRPTQSNFNESDSQNAEETAANASASFASSEHPEAQHKKRRKKVTTSERLCGLFTKVDGELREEREHERQERGPFFFWAMDIAKSLEVLPRPTGLKLKMNISQMIFEAQLLEERENQFEHTAVEDFDGGGFEGRRFEEDHFDEDGFEENSIYRFGAAACISTESYLFAMRVRRILLLKKKIVLLLLLHHARRQRSIVRSTRRTEGKYSTLMKILVTDETNPQLFGNSRSWSTISKIVLKTCQGLVEALKAYVHLPSSEQEWRDIARGFKERWSFPHVLGCIDGKHIKLKKPAKSGSNYFNRKKDFSTVLLAVADSRYKFIYYDLGEFGHNHDSTIFQNSSLGVALSNEELDLPEDASLPDSTRYLISFLETIPRRQMDYFNKFKSRVHSVAAQVNNALPGNPITREYEVLEQVATAGPGLFWSIYAGKKYSTGASCSVWMFEKKAIEKWPKYERELFLETMRQGVANLTRLRHPRLLVVEHALAESRDSFAFCTEPVFSSLANVLGKTENLQKKPDDVENFELLDVDIRHGLFQLAEALAFLHFDGKMLHRNLCPESVIISAKGAWKLAGFDFCIQGTSGSSGKPTFEMMEWDQRTMAVVQPMLDYVAPEFIVGGRCDMYADMYSLGVLAFAVFNRCRSPFAHDNNLDKFRKNVEQLKHLQPDVLASLPPKFRDDVKMCLNFTPDLRPDATQFSKIVYFDDVLTKTLNYFDSLMQMDNGQKMQFFKGLPAVLAKFPKRPLLQKVMPYLAAEFTIPDLIPFILPSVFLIAEQTTTEEFLKAVLPPLVPVFSMDRPYQIVLLLLQKMELLLQKAPENQLRTHVLPLIYNAIGSETIKVQVIGA
ncbi:hypothetical protein QR680_017321 [Steinernema hermaphroditum]|uniref:Protein kinase domain-containing protein n=1 Tax=Steinernema hermaphroditum TaxID=289476 RepID=A0AA39HE49_9BILA|nr:hypothetical protein QR680_017321 [Steinernema hermaphroditum]